MDDLRDYPDRFYGHTHQNLLETNYMHDDYHSDYFHIHVTGVLPETGRSYLQYTHGIVFGYFCIILLVLVYHATCRPRIDNSRRQYRCQ